MKTTTKKLLVDWGGKQFGNLATMVAFRILTQRERWHERERWRDFQKEVSFFCGWVSG